MALGNIPGGVSSAAGRTKGGEGALLLAEDAARVAGVRVLLLHGLDVDHERARELDRAGARDQGALELLGRRVVVGDPVRRLDDGVRVQQRRRLGPVPLRRGRGRGILRRGPGLGREFLGGGGRALGRGLGGAARRPTAVMPAAAARSDGKVFDGDSAAASRFGEFLGGGALFGDAAGAALAAAGDRRAAGGGAAAPFFDAENQLPFFDGCGAAGGVFVFRCAALSSLTSRASASTRAVCFLESATSRRSRFAPALTAAMTRPSSRAWSPPLLSSIARIRSSSAAMSSSTSSLNARNSVWSSAAGTCASTATDDTATGSAASAAAACFSDSPVSSTRRATIPSMAASTGYTRCFRSAASRAML